MSLDLFPLIALPRNIVSHIIHIKCRFLKKHFARTAIGGHSECIVRCPTSPQAERPSCAPGADEKRDTLECDNSFARMRNGVVFERYQNVNDGSGRAEGEGEGG
ncbi:hypothetical protein Trydic_g23340 [Trypoxylus dichotomus]